MAYSLIEPFGQPRVDDGFRGVLAMNFNINRGEAEPLSPADFLPAWRPPEEPEDDEEALLAFFERRVETRPE